MRHRTPGTAPYSRHLEGLCAALLLGAAPAPIPAPDDWDGHRTSVCRAGDVDCDGVPDVAFSPPEAGFVRLVSGATGEALREYRGEGVADGFGRAIANAGDVDLDGVEDLAVGACDDADRGGGYVHVLSGRTGERLHRLAAAPGYRNFGSSVAAGGDLDGDGACDVVVACVHTALHAGSPASGRMLWTRLLRPGGYMHADASTLGVVSDVDGDGLPDLCVGANEAWSTDRGYARLVSSATGQVLAAWEPEAWHEGVDVAPLGDVDGDGFVDVVVATRYEPKLELRSGRDLALLRRFAR